MAFEAAKPCVYTRGVSKKEKPIQHMPLLNQAGPSKTGKWIRLGLLLLAFVLLALVLWFYWRSLQVQPRVLDAIPREYTLPDYLPEGQAQARFDLYTGGDQMGQRSQQTGLVVRWGYQNKGYWQIIASCQEVGRGNALGDIDERVLDLAACNGQLLTLINEGGKIVVKRGDAPDQGRVVWEQTLVGVNKTVRDKE